MPRSMTHCMYFDSIRLNAARCDRSDVPLTSLDGDLANNRLPNFSYIMPNCAIPGMIVRPPRLTNGLTAWSMSLQASSALGSRA